MVYDRESAAGADLVGDQTNGGVAAAIGGFPPFGAELPCDNDPVAFGQ